MIKVRIATFTFCFALWGALNSAFAQKIHPKDIWTLENNLIVAQFGYTDDRSFGLIDIKEKVSGKIWNISKSTNLIWFRLADSDLSSRMVKYRMLSCGVLDLQNEGKKCSFVLTWGTLDSVVFNAEIYPDQPFLRMYYSYHPDTSSSFNLQNNEKLFVNSADLLNLSFDAIGKFESLHLNQWWRPETGKGNFEVIKNNLMRSVVKVQSGAYGRHCSWVTVREAKSGNGIIAGWEFNGRAEGLFWQAERRLNLRVGIDPVNWAIPVGGHFESPASFVGFFKGDWDEAGRVTREFVEKVLMKPMPQGFKLPDVMFDSWGYGTAYGKDVWGEDIDEEKMCKAARIAAGLGAEVFTVDLGWSRLIGDWHEDRRKFPNGLRALSDYVHSLGMKFGLHIALLEAHADAPVLKENPDWRVSRGNGYFGADSLCPAHWPVKDWLTREITRVIRDYNVDWVLQDGENMVKVCEKNTHTHHPQGSNYANALALDEVVSRIQLATPNTVWENCEDGGNMMTYKMVQNYHTSILEDAVGSLPSRRAVYGVTYAFPLRYTLRYVPEQNPTAYDLRSYMLGGPIVLMQKITEWNEKQIALVRRELDLYRSLRPKMEDGKVYHLLRQPNGKNNDAIQIYNEELDWSAIFVYRPENNINLQSIKPRGLKPDSSYRVRFQGQNFGMVTTGKDLMKRGINVNLPIRNSAEIVYIEKVF